MANRLLTASGPEPPQPEPKSKPMIRDTRCWGYRANPEAPNGCEGRIFPDEQARTEAGWGDSPANLQKALAAEPKETGLVLTPIEKARAAKAAKRAAALQEFDPAKQAQ